MGCYSPDSFTFSLFDFGALEIKFPKNAEARVLVWYQWWFSGSSSSGHGLPLLIYSPLLQMCCPLLSLLFDLLWTSSLSVALLVVVPFESRYELLHFHWFSFPSSQPPPRKSVFHRYWRLSVKWLVEYNNYRVTLAWVQNNYHLVVSYFSEILYSACFLINCIEFGRVLFFLIETIVKFLAVFSNCPFMNENERSSSKTLVQLQSEAA